MTNEPVKRSNLGIASFLISISTFAVVVVLLIIALAISDKRNHSLSDKFSEFAFYTFIFGAPVSHLIGLILGIVALFQKRYAKGFAVFGIILNILFPALGVLIIFVLLSAASGFR